MRMMVMCVGLVLASLAWAGERMPQIEVVAQQSLGVKQTVSWTIKSLAKDPAVLGCIAMNGLVLVIGSINYFDLGNELYKAALEQEKRGDFSLPRIDYCMVFNYLVFGTLNMVAMWSGLYANQQKNQIAAFKAGAISATDIPSNKAQSIAGMLPTLVGGYYLAKTMNVISTILRRGFDKYISNPCESGLSYIGDFISVWAMVYNFWFSRTMAARQQELNDLMAVAK